MRKKIFVLAITLAAILASITVPQNIDVKASEDYGDPGIDYDYIYDKTDDLSQIVFHPSSDDRGREFGEDGELEAAEYIEDWMNDIDLENVHQEKIDQVEDSDELDKKKQFDKDQDICLDIKVIDKKTQQIIDQKNNIDCFPFLNGNYTDPIDVYNVRVVERFMWAWPCKQIVLFDADWRDPWYWLFFVGKNRLWINTYRARGFILIGDSNDNVNTKFMGPSFKAQFLKPGFSINYTIGEWIRNYLDDYKVIAHITSEWAYKDVDSYNVIGQINGTDTETVSIVCAHLDCWWNQGAIDESLETALVLGIAKYMKERNLTLKHTVKFIAFAGEENAYRGSRDYILDHLDENIKWVINPGNFGHSDKYYYGWLGEYHDLKFETPSNNDTLRYLARDITNNLQFTDRTDVLVDWYYSEFGAEDSTQFVNASMCDGAIQFGRWPYRGYHRDGSDHTEGDVMGLIDNETAQVECEVVASVALHLTVDTEHKFDNVSIASFDKSGNGENDSVQVDYTLTSDTNTSLFGRVKGKLYNSTGHCLKEKKSCLYFLESGETDNGSMVFTVPPCQPDGEFTVRLVVMDYWDEVDDWYNESINLSSYSLAVSNFSYITQSVKTHNFIDNSLPSPNATITSWNWSFDDGNYSSSQNPNHTYYDNGTYNVSLTIIDSSNLTNTTYMSIIVENEQPSVVIDNIANVWCINDSLNFTSDCSDNDGSIVNWTWDFGDGNYSYTSNATFNYSKSGFYTVNLTVTDDDNSSNSTTLDMIIAGAMIDDSYQSDNPNTYRWKSIQSGVANVSDDDIIYVKNGGYNEGVIVNKSIYFLGENSYSVHVYNNGGIVFDIQNGAVALDNFSINDGNTGVLINSSNNCSILNCNISFCTYGVKVSTGADNNSIQGCYFEKNSYAVFVSGSYNWIGSKVNDELGYDTIFLSNTYGVYFDNSNDNVVMGCSINASSGGSPSALYGICLDDSDNNTILHCDIFNANTSSSNGYGVYLDDSTNNYIYHCFIHDNNKGVYLTSSSENHIAMNNVSINSAGGLSINMFSSYNNTVTWNDFIGNGGGRIPQTSDDGVSSNWNSVNNRTYYYVAGGEGNYWSDYTGVDNDGDGIGDTRYTILGTAGASDDYPVMVPRDFFN